MKESGAMNQEDSVNRSERLKSSVNIIAFVAGMLAVSLEVFLHRSRTFGERYVGVQGAMVVLAVPLFGSLWPDEDLRPLFLFLLAFLFMCLLIRVSVLKRRFFGGLSGHTRYTGTPRIMPWVRGMSERTVKVILEPAIAFFSGAFLLAVNQPLGSYLMLAALGMFVSVNFDVGYDRVRAMDMNDAMLEQQDLATRLRQFRDDRN